MSSMTFFSQLHVLRGKLREALSISGLIDRAALQDINLIDVSRLSDQLHTPTLQHSNTPTQLL